MSAPTEIPDESMKYLILGAMSAVCRMEAFPVKVNRLQENTNDEGIIQSFTIVTASGLGFKVNVEFEGQVDESLRR